METKRGNGVNSGLYTPVPVVDNKHDNNEEIENCVNLSPLEIGRGPRLGKRHIQIFSCFIFIILENCEKITLSTALVAMTDSASSANPNIPTYNWTNKGTILSSIFWSTALVEPFAGWLTNYFRPKWFLVTSLGVSSIAALFIPTLAESFGSRGVIAGRIIQGFGQAFMYPCIFGLLAKWAPQTERMRFTAYIKSGHPIGSLLSFFLSGFIASSWYGWPMLFYSFGTVGLVWCLFYAYFGSNGPEYHSTITEDEKRFIINGLTHTTLNQKKLSVPWVKILTCLPVWALLINECSQFLTNRTLQTQLPAYMAHCMKFKLQSNGLLSALPYLTILIFMYVFYYIIDILKKKEILSHANLMKTFVSMGLLIPAAAFLCLGNTGPSDAILAVCLLIIAVGGISAQTCISKVNYLDLAPNYASLLMGVICGCADIVGSSAPLLVQYVVTDENDPNQWKIVFYYTAGTAIVASIIFITFSSTEVQPWNEQKASEEEKQLRA